MWVATAAHFGAIDNRIRGGVVDLDAIADGSGIARYHRACARAGDEARCRCCGEHASETATVECGHSGISHPHREHIHHHDVAARSRFTVVADNEVERKHLSRLVRLWIRMGFRQTNLRSGLANIGIECATGCHIVAGTRRNLCRRGRGGQQIRITSTAYAPLVRVVGSVGINRADIRNQTERTAAACWNRDGGTAGHAICVIPHAVPACRIGAADRENCRPGHRRRQFVGKGNRAD